MYGGVSILHMNQLYLIAGSGACTEHKYVLFCMVKTGRQSQLRAVATALQVMSKSCRWSLWRVAGLRAPLLLPPPQHFEHKCPEQHMAPAEPGAESCAPTSASFTRRSMPRVAPGAQGGDKCHPEPKHKHTSRAWLARILDPGCQVWDSVVFWGSFPASALKPTKRVGYQSLSLPEVLSSPWAYLHQTNCDWFKGKTVSYMEKKLRGTHRETQQSSSQLNLNDLEDSMSATYRYP